VLLIGTYRAPHPLHNARLADVAQSRAGARAHIAGYERVEVPADDVVMGASDPVFGDIRGGLHRRSSELTDSSTIQRKSDHRADTVGGNLKDVVSQAWIPTIKLRFAHRYLAAERRPALRSEAVAAPIQF
jgi:hypothetical protein